MSPTHVKAAALLACAVFMGWALFALQAVLVPVLLALLLAYLLDPVVVFLERRGLSRRNAIAVLYLLGLGALLLAVFFLVPWLAGQVKALLARLGELIDKMPETAVAVVAWTEGKLGVSLGLREEALSLSQRTKDWLTSNRMELLEASSGALSTGWSGLRGFLSLLLDACLVPLYAYFFLLGLDRLPGKLRDLLPLSYREPGMRVLTQIHQTMASFFRIRLLLCFGKGVVAALGMALGGIPFGILVGLGSGAMSLVPFLAFPAASALGCALALLDGQGASGVLWVLGALGAAELFEALATPLVLGREMSLHPAVVLFALLVGGRCLGILGLLLAVPLASGVKILWRELLFPWWREVADRPEGASP